MIVRLCFPGSSSLVLLLAYNSFVSRERDENVPPCPAYPSPLHTRLLFLTHAPAPANISLSRPKWSSSLIHLSCLFPGSLLLTLHPPLSLPFHTVSLLISDKLVRLSLKLILLNLAHSFNTAPNSSVLKSPLGCYHGNREQCSLLGTRTHTQMTNDLNPQRNIVKVPHKQRSRGHFSSLDKE